MPSDAVPVWPPDNARVYAFDEIPVGRDIHVLGESQMAALHREWTRYLAEPDGTAPEHPNMHIDYRMCAVETLKSTSCEINVCINQNWRYHAAVRTLPRSKFITCVHFWNYQKRAYLVVAQDWFDDIAGGQLSLYALVDSIGMRALLERQGRLEKKQVQALRAGIDALADQHTDHAFLAFADNVIVKTNWSAAYSRYDESYRPEHFLAIVDLVRKLFGSALGLSAYAIVTQGFNHSVDEPLLGLSARGNHVFFGGLATPFVELFEIDAAARAALRDDLHSPGDLYLSQTAFLTLNFKHYQRRDDLMEIGEPFESKVTVPDFCRYHVFTYDELLPELEQARDRKKVPA
jgi:hypothetical protein